MLLVAGSTAGDTEDEGVLCCWYISKQEPTCALDDWTDCKIWLIHKLRSYSLVLDVFIISDWRVSAVRFIDSVNFWSVDLNMSSIPSAHGRRGGALGGGLVPLFC